MQSNNMKAMSEVLNRVHDYLGELIRDNLVEDTPRASDLADDVYDAIHGSHSTAEKSSAVGDAAAMREALEYASRVLTKWRQDAPFNAWNEYGEAIDKCRAALAKTPRQCDVGTAWEQAERFIKHCQSFMNRDGIKACMGCPCCGVVMYGKCELAWAHMPYEEGGAK